MERFIERALLYRISRGDIEPMIERQEIRVERGFDEKYGLAKFETIGVVRKRFFTVQKAEDKSTIVVITLWESSRKEVGVWFSKRK